MKWLLLALFLLPFVAASQILESLKLPESSNSRYNWKRAIAPASIMFAAGATWATHETVVHHNEQFFKTFPGASRRFWGADSWRNKYVNGDPEQGRNGVPIWFTDGKHLTASAHHVLVFSAGMTITIGEKRPVWHYLLDVGISFGAYSLGNGLARKVYD